MNTENLIDHVTSRDGTRIGYRRLGSGPGVILVHGGMQSSHNFSRLAAALSDAFTVYVPDRRGRGLSGPHGDGYCLARECEDIQALVEKSGAQNLFGLSSGAIVALQTALALPDAIRRLAVYEPPLAVGAFSPIAWVPRFDREVAQGDLASAMITVIKGTGDTSLLTALPRFVLRPLLARSIEGQARRPRNGEVPLKTLIPTMHFDPQLVAETAGSPARYAALRAEVLLLGGDRSRDYLKAALDALERLLPQARRVEFSGIGHLAADDHGRPEQVAQELRCFFA